MDNLTRQEIKNKLYFIYGHFCGSNDRAGVAANSAYTLWVITTAFYQSGIISVLKSYDRRGHAAIFFDDDFFWNVIWHNVEFTF